MKNLVPGGLISLATQLFAYERTHKIYASHGITESPLGVI